MNQPEKRWPILGEAIFWAGVLTIIVLACRLSGCST